jgi:hypothetical protein
MDGKTVIFLLKLCTYVCNFTKNSSTVRFQNLKKNSRMVLIWEHAVGTVPLLYKERNCAMNS